MLPLPPNLANLLLGHGVFPHEPGHGESHDNLLGYIPGAQDLKEEVPGQADEETGEGVGVQGREKKQIGPFAQLDGEVPWFGGRGPVRKGEIQSVEVETK